MREYGFSALTSVISEGSPSSSRIVRIAFMPAVPPPMTRCRRAIFTGSPRTAGPRSQTRLAWRLRPVLPPLGALRAGVRRVRGVPLEGRHADDRLRGVERTRLHVRARELAPETAGALLGVDPEDVRRGREHGHRFFRSPRFVDAPRSRRPMNSSSGIAAIVIPATPPRAPSSTDTRDTVALSGASMTERKS